MSQNNPNRHEIDVYAAEYVLTGDQSRAFRKTFPDSTAKPESIHQRASKLHSIAKVQSRIAELQDEQAEKDKAEFDLTAEQIKRMLSEAYQEGMRHKVDAQGNMIPINIPAAVSALSEVNRMNGNHAPTKSELTNPDGSLTPTVIERRIVKPDDSPSD